MKALMTGQGPLRDFSQRSTSPAKAICAAIGLHRPPLLQRAFTGANTLDGGGGKDALFGMGGADNFRFSMALGDGTSFVRIADFAASTDKIQLDDAVFTALTALGALDASAFKDIATSAKDADDRIIYNSDTGALGYDADGSGSAFANVRFATITGSPVFRGRRLAHRCQADRRASGRRRLELREGQRLGSFVIPHRDQCAGGTA